MNQEETNAGKVFCEDDIIHIVLAPATELENADIDQLYSAVRRVATSDNYFIIVDATDIVASANEVRDYAAKHPDAVKTKACGIVCNSLSVKIIVNFFLKFNKPVFPTRMFTSMNDAKEWASALKNPAEIRHL
jgi:hypothetical protein